MFSTVIVQCNVTTVIVLFCNNVTLLLCNMRTNPKSACLCIQMCLYSVTTQIKASAAVKVYLKPMLSLSSKIHINFVVFIAGILCLSLTSPNQQNPMVRAASRPLLSTHTPPGERNTKIIMVQHVGN